jgi:outer membrane protein assembly factor BamE (lipoprotein component of BamABCDE complex)
MKRCGTWCLVLLFTVLLGGCVSVGRDFDHQAALQIQEDKTTKTEIRGWFGAPYERGVENGYETWTYRYIRKDFLRTEKCKALKVYFQSNGSVKTTSYTCNNPEWQISR